MKPRELTEEECRTAFIEHVRALVDYWSDDDARKGDLHSRLSGLAHSILAAIDGCAFLPAFELKTLPHESDKEYNESNGDNWWPTGTDIAGGLHELLYKGWPKPTPAGEAKRGATTGE